MNPTTATNLPQFETLQALWMAQPRGVRVFSPLLEVLWDNTSDRLTRYPIFHDLDGQAATVPPEGMGRNAWPVTRVAAEGAPVSRNYWVSAGAEGARCYRVRAYPIDAAGMGRLIVEETERVEAALCHDERLIHLDAQLSEMMNRLADLLMNEEEIDPLKLRLANANLQPCRQIKKCQRQECPAWENANLRCWEISGTHCRQDNECLDMVGKFHFCNRCEAYLMACPDPLTRVGENFNRLMAFLQVKFEESLEIQRQVQHSERLAAVGELALGIAHEIKNPLGVIMGRLDCLGMELESLSTAELADDLQVLKNHAARMRQTLDGLMTFAQPGESRRVPVRLNEVVLETLPLVHKTLEKSAVRLKTRLAHHLPEILGDPVAIQQVLLNLLLNARDALGERGGLIHIVTRPGPRGGAAVKVSDNGCGIPAAEQKKIFSPFFTTKASRGGQGLGLAICRRIMDRHRGRIHVQSRPGRGTRFILEFRS